MDRAAWRTTVGRITESGIQLAAEQPRHTWSKGATVDSKVEHAERENLKHSVTEIARKMEWL